MPLLLAIETSQRIGGVALRDANGRVHEEMLAPKKRHDDDLMPAIDRTFRRAGCSSRDLDEHGAVAVSVGPGGFTGLRIAIATAKMLAETRRAKVIAVPSALVAAETCERDITSKADSLMVALAVKDDSFWCTILKRDESTGWRLRAQPDNPALVRGADSDLAAVNLVLADEFFPSEARARCEAQGIPVIEPRFSPSACLVAASRMADAGEFTDPLHLLPLYPRPPEAVSLWERRGKPAP